MVIKADESKSVVGVIKEESLIAPIIKHFENNGYLTCTEFRTPWAIPDVLAVRPNRTKVKQRINKGQTTPLTHEIYWRVLDLIPDKMDNSYIDVVELAQCIGLSPSYLRTKILNLLRRNHYIEICDERCVKINGFHPYSNTLASIEAKVKDWKHAGEQALRHQKFVNQAYVALPSQHIKPAIKNLNEFHRANLGLLEIGENEKLIQHYTPEYAKPACTSLYNVALDTLWSRLINEERNREDSNGNKYPKSLLCTTGTKC